MIGGLSQLKVLLAPTRSYDPSVEAWNAEILAANGSKRDEEAPYTLLSKRFSLVPGLKLWVSDTETRALRLTLGSVTISFHFVDLNVWYIIASSVYSGKSTQTDTAIR